LKRRNNRVVLFSVFAAGISSVVAQLIIIREFLAGFEGNEFVIALILLCWMMSTGMGSLIAMFLQARTGRASVKALGLIAVLIAVLPTVLILMVRYIRNTILVQGASVGFYPTLAFVFGAITPYALLIGIFFPYSLFVLRSEGKTFPASSVYALDSLGAAAGGAAFSLVLVYLLTPFGTLLAMNIILIAASCLLLGFAGMNRALIAALVVVAAAVHGAGMALEKDSLRPRTGKLVSYQESFFGRITITKDHELYTVFVDGVPALSGQNRIMAEEACHYPLSQLKSVRQVLLASSVSGIMDEISKYQPEEIDYAQLDPYLSEVEMRLGLVKPVQGLRVIAQDGRAYLKRTDKKYDAILVNYPEPKTFQTNRYFTEEFMRLAKAHLNPGGVLSFSVEGYESYLSATARSQVSSLYNTASAVFSHVLILPGQRIYFIASASPLSDDIPGLLAGKGIKTGYIGYYFSGDISKERMSSLMKLLDPHAPRNKDLKPYLMRVAYEGWFAKYSSYPLVFFIGLAVFFAIYLKGLRQGEFVLFTSGFVNMGSEILTIFGFQILLGFLYMKISLIITVFLAGLIPGILLGQRFTDNIRQNLIIADGLLVMLLVIFSALLMIYSQGMNELFFYSFAFLISVVCGFQFPLVAGAHGGGNIVAARAFSVDLVGAALGNVLLSALFIPFFGIIFSCEVLIVIKLASIIIQLSHGKDHPESLPSF
jgi:spermidine synthase